MNHSDAADRLRPRLAEYLADTGREIVEPKGGVCPICNGGHDTPCTHIKDNKLKCFTCGWTGDLFDLIAHDSGARTFPEQVKIAADHFNMTIAGERPDPARRPLKQTQPPAADFTAYYKQCQDRAEKGIAYLMGRGISREVCAAHSIGYDPALVSPQLSQAAGQIVTIEAVIIPVTKSYYNARNIDPAAAKDARHIKPAAKKGAITAPMNVKNLDQLEPVFIVEGSTDALSIETAGGRAIATNGAAIVNQLINEIKQRTAWPVFIIALDEDKAGLNGSNKLTAELSKMGASFLKAMITGQHKDANERLQADPDGLRAAIQDAIAQADPEKIKEAEKLRTLEEYHRKNSAAGYLYNFCDEAKDRATRPPAATGFKSLDRALDGGLREGLYILGAASSLGKTTLVLQMADNIAAAGTDVLLFSLEMSKHEITCKSISRATYQRRTGKERAVCHLELMGGVFMGYSPDSLRFIMETVAHYQRTAGKHLVIFEETQAETGGRFSVKDIGAAVANHISLTGNKPIVIIDYLQIIKPADAKASDKQNTDTAVTELKRISRAHKIPVLAISSLNREGYTDPINMTAFKETGSIEYSSDILIGLQIQGADEMLNGNKTANLAKISKTMTNDIRHLELKVLKNRSGALPVEPIEIDFCGKYNVYMEPGKATGAQ